MSATTPSSEPDAMAKAMENMSEEQKAKMLLTGIIADIVSTDENVGDNSAEFNALAGTIDPRELPEWDVDVAPPSFEGLNKEEVFAAKVAYGRGPVAKHLAMCMPPRASAAAKLGQAGGLQQLHPEAQWLKSFEFVAQCHNTYRERRRFFLQDPMGLECLLLDVADPTRTCPSEVPHGPEGRRAAALRVLGPDASKEAVEKVLESDKTSWSEEDEAAARANAPLLVVRYEHVPKGLPDTKARLLQAHAALGDGFLSQEAVQGAATHGVTSVPCESAAEVRACAAELARNAKLLSAHYAVHFAGQSPNHRQPGAVTGYLPSFLVPPALVRERPPNTACGNPSCLKEEEHVLKAAHAAFAKKNEESKEAEARAAAVKAATTRFMVCTACKSASYCSKECQKAHWGCGHKEFCTAEKARRKVIAEGLAAPEAKGVAKAKGGNKKKGRGKRDKVQ
eukprot:CAMPEP_0172585362 /NCGR_PEP_ID=MMETSP1068-20121228/4789_1 /TAXON_ID=35684 /ORGANISM="Pseudopedinella elastica, Strain CCMP716" /LENGTH=450 /DNA_ID=CAMNT_0013379791 /DNA_START=27 /DNA_END=1379 /DNA_ORIENTATION=+